MKKIYLFLVGFFCFCIASFGQASNEKILYVIDSIPLLKDPESGNRLFQEDIADVIVVRGKDTLKRLGWEEVDGITFIFTKEYRKRPDSLKSIPSLKQMVMRDGTWNLNDTPYSGKYINYYINGRIQNEGTLLDGKLNGVLIIYNSNGLKRSVTYYKNGIRHGISNDYFTTDSLMQTREFKEGKASGEWKRYYINGQLEHERKLKKETSYDTSITYYSTGKVKQMRLIRNGIVLANKKIDEINFYTPRFYQSLNSGDIKEANKIFFKLWKIDSTSTETYFMGGRLFMKEFRFEEAIAEFNNALGVEPFMRESLVFRALARINKYKYVSARPLSKNNKEDHLTLEDFTSLPPDEQEKVCSDLQQAEYLNFSEFYLKRMFPAAILNYCDK